MRLFACLMLMLLMTGSSCGAEPDGEDSKSDSPKAAAGAEGQQPAESAATATDGPHTTHIVKPPQRGDLRTRKTGIDWPRFLGPNADSKSPETGILTQWPEGGPPILWQRELGTGYGAPVISQGRLYQFSRFGDQARLTCRRSETGQELWRFEYPTDYEDMYGYNNGPRCSPVVDGDRVYIFGSGGRLHCLDAINGRMIWHVDTQREFGVVQNFFGVGSTPWIEDDLLIVMVGGSPPESQDVGGRLNLVKSNGSGIVAFDKMTGQMKYKISDELASYSSPLVATIGQRRLGLAFARGGLLGFEPKTGKIDFHFPWRAEVLESVNASGPVVVEDEVLISETYGPGAALLKLKPGGYDQVWTDEAKGRDKSLQTHWNTPIYHQGYVYGSSGRHSNNAELRCVQWKTGKVMWSIPRLSRCSLLYVDGHFVCLAEYGDLILFKANPEKFEPVANTMLQTVLQPGAGPKQLLTYPAWAAPILSHGLLYVRGEDRLVCLELIPEKADRE